MEEKKINSSSNEREYNNRREKIQEVEEFVESVQELIPKNSRLLGKTALENAGKMMQRKESVKKLQELEVPQLLLQNERRMLNTWVDKYVNEEYEAQEVRDELSQVPSFVKRSQNKIFSRLIKTGEKNFVTEIIKPYKKELNADHRLIMSTLIGERSFSVYYDFVGRLTEKDENGEYVIPDATVKNFISWYHAKIAKKEEDNTEHAEGLVCEYREYLNLAAKEGFLPKFSQKNVENLTKRGNQKEGLMFGYIDAITAYEEGLEDFFITKGCCIYNLLNRRKKICMSLEVGEFDYLGVFYHELTHAVAGDQIDFNNIEAGRIINEGLTESIAERIMCTTGFDSADTDEERQEIIGKFEDFGGELYKHERQVLKYLQSGGRKVITPMTFYEAYAEPDAVLERIRDGEDDSYDSYEEWSEKKKQGRTYGPAQQKLINELLESFPDCKDLSGIGKMIEEKFMSMQT